MRKLAALLVLCLVCLGCSSVTSLQKFLDKLPATDMDEAKHVFRSPLWNDTIIASGVSIDSDGLLDVETVSAELNIPLWGTISTTTISGVKQIPTAKQRAAAEAVKAAARAQRAKTAAAKAESASKAASEKAGKTP